MGRIARLIWIDEIIWTQFQALYPRQASTHIENYLRDAVNLHIDCGDDTISALRDDLQNSQSKIDALLESKRILMAKLQSAQENKQREYAIQKEHSKKIISTAQAMKNAGVNRDFAEDIL